MRRPETQSFHSLKKTKEEKPDWATAHPTPFHISISTRIYLSISISLTYLLGCNGTVLYGCNYPQAGKQAGRQTGRQAIKPPNPPIPTLIYPPNTLGERTKSQPDPWVNVTKERMPMGKKETKGKTDEREGKKREQDRGGEGGLPLSTWHRTVDKKRNKELHTWPPCV